MPKLCDVIRGYDPRALAHYCCTQRSRYPIMVARVSLARYLGLTRLMRQLELGESP